jgi:hypothetical protein
MPQSNLIGGSIMTSGIKIPSPDNSGNEKNISKLSKEYTSALTALESCGADSKTVLFMFNNCGICFAFCERLITLREQGIDEYVLRDLVSLVYEPEQKGASK